MTSLDTPLVREQGIAARELFDSCEYRDCWVTRFSVRMTTSPLLDPNHGFEAAGARSGLVVDSTLRGRAIKRTSDRFEGRAPRPPSPSAT